MYTMMLKFNIAMYEYDNNVPLYIKHYIHSNIAMCIWLYL